MNLMNLMILNQPILSQKFEKYFETMFQMKQKFALGLLYFHLLLQMMFQLMLQPHLKKLLMFQNLILMMFQNRTLMSQMILTLMNLMIRLLNLLMRQQDPSQREQLDQSVVLGYRDKSAHQEKQQIGYSILDQLELKKLSLLLKMSLNFGLNFVHCQFAGLIADQCLNLSKQFQFVGQFQLRKQQRLQS